MGQQKHIIFLLFITICHSLLWTWAEGFIAKCYHKIPPPYSRNNIKYLVIDSAMHLHCIIYHCCFCFLVSKIGILEYINRSKRRKVFLRSEVLFPVFFLWALSVFYTAIMRPGNLFELPVCCVCNCDVHKNHRNMDKLTFHAPLYFRASYQCALSRNRSIHCTLHNAKHHLSLAVMIVCV